MHPRQGVYVFLNPLSESCLIAYCLHTYNYFTVFYRNCMQRICFLSFTELLSIVPIHSVRLATGELHIHNGLWSDTLNVWKAQILTALTLTRREVV